MDEVRGDHFAHGKRLIEEYEGCLIKTIGDSLMVAFRSIDSALDFARRFLRNPGAPKIEIRAGIHVGSVDVKTDDLFGTNVNLAARVAGAFKGAEIWLSNEAMADLNHHRPEKFRHLKWTAHKVTPSGFEETTFWAMSEASEATAQPTYRTFTAKLPTVDSLLIGRDKELEFLDQAWANPKTKIVQIIAPGGTGKTALMDKWYKSHLDECTIFGWSFYSQGVREDSQTSSDPFFAEILPFFGITVPQGATVWTRAEAIANHLRHERVLLILDGLEPLQQSTGEIRDSAMAALLHELRTKNAGMVLCTTRVYIKDLPVDELSLACDLQNLEPKDGASLLREKGVDGTQDELEQASRDFYNHALAVTLLGTYLKEFHYGDIRHRTDIRSLLTDESDQDGHANRVMASYVTMFEGKPELAVLRALGYFDRPAEPEALRLILKETPQRLTLNRLKKLGLILTADPSQEIDCHPLVRVYLAKVMRTSAPIEFKDGHGLFFHHYSNKAPYQPETREALIPLFYAIYHGCQAGQYMEACDAVCRARIYRDSQYYLVRKLGLFGTSLSLLANFFSSPWTRIVEGLSPEARAWIFGETASSLRAVGRLSDAITPMHTAVEEYARIPNWLHTARIQKNLSELYMALGNLEEARTAAYQAVDHAIRSEIPTQIVASKAALATVLHQTGDLRRASQWFRDADHLQRRLEPNQPRLYGVRGFRYCDLLLDLGRTKTVLRRAKLTLKTAGTNFGLLAQGLDHLSLGRVHPAASSDASKHLMAAVDFLRRSEYQEFLCLALLARATEHDLEEAFRIATRSGMRLHLADHHLIQARRLKSIEHFKKAEGLINATGYGRRKPALEELRKELNAA